jgi:5'-3' exonuclease
VSSPAKKLFLVDAMAHVYRAFYAPMMRMNAPSGLPTKVPFLGLSAGLPGHCV